MKERNPFAKIAEGFDALVNKCWQADATTYKVDIRLSPEVTDKSSLAPVDTE